MSKDNHLLDYKKKVIDQISSSFCAAKWLNATIWLGSGKTSSCHHPPSHKISEDEIRNNPSAIHNTLIKKVLRKQMLKGIRPKECEYCWKMEDLNDEIISDRVFKTMIYSDEAINKISNLSWKEDVLPETLEISFNRVCNLACSYCGPTYSTRWGSDIKSKGPYVGLTGDCNGEFSNDGSSRDYYLNNENNPYLEAFWKWWPTLSQSLKELRVTGGEPLLADEFWKLLDKFANDKIDIRFAVNSNLCAKDELIEKLILKSKQTKEMVIYTSCEATGAHAEYIRDGLVFENFIKNCVNVLENANISSFNLMLTINSLCLYSVTDFLNIVLTWKEKYKNIEIGFTLNPLRYPSFMSPSVLPDTLKKNRIETLKSWREDNLRNPLVTTWELASLDRLIDYIINVDKVHIDASERNIQLKDFKLFYRQYDQRRGKSFRDTFPKDLVDWYDSIDV